MSKHSKKTYVSLFLIGFSVGSLAAQGYETDSIEMKLVAATRSTGRGGISVRHSLRAFCPTPEQQGFRPICVSLAVAHAAYTIQKRVGKEKPFSAIFLAHYVHRWLGFDKAVTLPHGLQQLKEHGTLTHYITNPQKIPSAKDSIEALKNRIKHYEPVHKNSLKEPLDKNTPVIVGITVDDAFRNLPKNHIWNGFVVPVGKKMGHAVCVIGYDEEKKAYQVINSWGTEWSDGGFGWISYDAMQRHCTAAFIITP
jgi:Papain family cysteine protease